MSVQELRYKNVYDINANSLTLNMLEASPGPQSLWINKANGHLYRGSVNLEGVPAGQSATDFFIPDGNDVTAEVPIPTTVAEMDPDQQLKTKIDEMGIRLEARMDELAHSLKQAELRIDKVNARCNDLAADNAQLRKRMAAIIRDDLTWTKKDESGDGY